MVAAVKKERVRSPMEIMKNLPGEDCGECGYDTCFEFALGLVERLVRLDKCPKLSKKGEKELNKLIAPPMYKVTFGVLPNVAEIGEEEALHREDLAFFGETVIAYDVWDTMSEERLKDRIEGIKGLEIQRMKNVYRANAIAIRSVSGDSSKFRNTVAKVAEMIDLPFILCSLDAKVLKAGIRPVKEKKPLLYAATKDNWADVLKIAKENTVAVAIFSPNDLNMMGSIAKTFSKEGINDLVLDPGTFVEPGSLLNTFDNLTMLRKACVERMVKEVSYPTMAVPAVFSLSFKDRIRASQYETALANALITRGINLVVMHSLQPWSFLPMVYLREGIFKHPKAEERVEPGIYEIAEPDEMSPLLVTANYTLTYSIVSGDLERGKIPCHLLVVDTGGLSLDTVAGTGEWPDMLEETVDEFKVGEKVNHRVLIMGDVVADSKEDVEEKLPDWKIVIGPKDSTQITSFLKDKWKEFIETG